MFQIKTVLEPFEGFFNTPSLMVKIAEFGCWKLGAVEQIGHEDAHVSGRSDMAHQTHDLGYRGTFVIVSVVLSWCWQRNDLLRQSWTQKLAYAAETAASGGLFDAHAKRYAEQVKQGRQLAARLAPVHEQQVAFTESVKVLKQHLARLCSAGVKDF